jgi:ornithine decarboxylase
MRQKYEQLQRELGEAKIYYALKANPHREVVKLFQQIDAGFEISSEGELKLLVQLGVPPEKIISSNPIKSEAFIKSAYNYGVDLFAFDSYAEIEKLSRFAPSSKVYVRLSVSNKGSEWPLSEKFGVEIEDAAELLVQAERKHLKPYGITFHVGSQCTNLTTWVQAIRGSRVVWELVRSKGIKLQLLDIGGGFPIKYTKSVPSVAEIAQVVKEAIEEIFPDENIEIISEPGRALIGEAGVLVATVLAKAVRRGQKWLYLDVGVFNGLMESVGGIKYPLAVAKGGKVSKWMLAGPSCDSFDVISADIELPEPEVGDKVYIMSAGAYTTAYASQFNGFLVPKTYLV